MEQGVHAQQQQQACHAGGQSRHGRCQLEGGRPPSGHVALPACCCRPLAVRRGAATKRWTAPASGLDTTPSGGCPSSTHTLGHSGRRGPWHCGRLPAESTRAAPMQRLESGIEQERQRSDQGDGGEGQGAQMWLKPENWVEWGGGGAYYLAARRFPPPLLWCGVAKRLAAAQLVAVWVDASEEAGWGEGRRRGARGPRELRR